MLDVLQEDYVRTARAKDLPPATVIFEHALRNARTSLLTLIRLTDAGVLGGAIVTETVLALPGIGNPVVSAVLRRDYPLIQGALLVISGVYARIQFRHRRSLCRSLRACATEMSAVEPPEHARSRPRRYCCADWCGGGWWTACPPC
jgi:hypothetical protein